MTRGTEPSQGEFSHGAKIFAGGRGGMSLTASQRDQPNPTEAASTKMTPARQRRLRRQKVPFARADEETTSRRTCGFRDVDGRFRRRIFTDTLPYPFLGCNRRRVAGVALRQERDQETPDLVELGDDGGALVFQKPDAAFVIGGGSVFGTRFAEELRGRWPRR